MPHGKANENGSRPRRPAEVDANERSATAYTKPPLRSKAARERFLAIARTMGASADVVEAARKG